MKSDGRQYEEKNNGRTEVNEIYVQVYWKIRLAPVPLPPRGDARQPECQLMSGGGGEKRERINAQKEVEEK